MSKLLQEFINSKLAFRIIYSTPSYVFEERIGRICVLDSSFNPPHLGHYSLVKESLIYNYKDSLSDNKMVLLLLSVNNADKLTPQPASFHHRIEMMFKLADHIHESLKVDVKVGLTNHAKFVDKSNAICSYMNNYKQFSMSNIRLSFLVGFDTLIRILNPKYYVPNSLATALDGFFETSDLFCLTRSDDSISLEKQFEYLDSIASGNIDGVPKHWSSNIFLSHNESLELSKISSSSIRSNVSHHNEEWFNKVTPDIKNYIVNEDIYKS
mmetsp:Transcript_2269/g.2212  ORF Transcript_2269/g.2212 Transcript_2269/m.2212 type:complete len:268 (+) Transcript_2269:614-1417(+)